MIENIPQEETQQASQPPRERRPNLLKTRLSRRRFMQAMVGLGAGMAFGAKPAPAHAEGEEGGRAAEPVTAQETKKSYGGIDIFVDENGIPIAFQIEGEGYEKTHFSQEHINIIKENLEFAVANEVSQPAIRIDLHLPVDIAAPTPERPYITEAPEDVLSPEGTAAYGITIVNQQADNYSELGFRSSILDDHNILEPLRVLYENIEPGEEQPKITICNLNAEGLTWDLINGSPELVRFRPLLYSVQSRAHTKWQTAITENQQEIDGILTEIQRIKAASVNSVPDYGLLQSKLFLHKSRDMELRSMSTQAMVLDYLINNNDRTIGLYYPEREPDEAIPGYQGDEAVVFIASPELEKVTQRKIINLGFNHQGEVIVLAFIRDSLRRQENVPRIDGSYLSPDENTERSEEENSNYKYKSGGIGFFVYHELAHHILVTVFPKLAAKGKLEQSSFYLDLCDHPTVGPHFKQKGASNDYFAPDHDEKIADEVAMHVIRRAHEQWVTSNYTDNSGYSIVFKLPATEVDPERYQITGQSLSRPNVV